MDAHELVGVSAPSEVVGGTLRISDLQGCPVSRLRFGPVYFGTSGVQTVRLRNDGPRTCHWLGLLLQDPDDDPDHDDPDHPARQAVGWVPRQGRLGPGEHVTLAVRFSPLRKKKRPQSAGPQHYALSLRFEVVEDKHGFAPINAPPAGRGVELAVIGSGLPVRLLPKPAASLRFPGCARGQRSDLLCLLRNRCLLLAAPFRFRKAVHFRAEPASGVVAPGQCQEVVLSFVPSQLGRFRVRQKVDVLGHVTDPWANDDAAAELRLRPFHTITLDLSAVCHAQTTRPEPMLNPGITPPVTNPCGQRPRVPSTALARCEKSLCAAVLGAATTRRHAHRRGRSQGRGGEELVAFPNDRAASIRPSSPHTEYRTIFTGVRRYRYVDPDYAFTEREEAVRRRQRETYRDFIGQLRQNRLLKIQERQSKVEVEEEVDIGLVPAQGLVPPRLLLRDLEDTGQSVSQVVKPRPPRNHGALALLSVTEWQSDDCQVVERTDAVPSTSQEVADCSRTLSPEDLYQVDISPLTADFGDVCVGSSCVRTLTLTNRLRRAHVWLQLTDPDRPELHFSSPPAHVLLPPRSHATLALVFQRATPGHFHGVVSYTVNGHHPGQVLVRAHVVPPALELWPAHLELGPAPHPAAQSGYRGAVTLRNRGNRAADFTWWPVVTERGVLFSVRPATGRVEAGRELDCEVTWYPSFSSPAVGDFDLCVHGGGVQRLHCVAKVAPASVRLSETYLKMPSVPLNATSVRHLDLHNTGHSPAYFQVLDWCPLPGMVLSPLEGEVPVGGRTPLEIHFTPETIVKFDTRIKIALRNRKSIELRVGGSVEHPDIDISLPEFQFRGVHVGSERQIPFTLTNRSVAAASVAFDQSQHTDFTLRAPATGTPGRGSGDGVVHLGGLQTVECVLVFSPTQVAGYDFLLPLAVNGVSCVPPPPPPPPPLGSSLLAPPATSTSRSLSTTVTSRPAAVAVETWSRRVRGTALRALLELCPSRPDFQVEPCSPQPMAYTQEEEEEEEGAASHPYRELVVTVTTPRPTIAIVPDRLLLAPVPLNTVATATLTLWPTGYPGGCSVSAEVCEADEGSRRLSVVFPQGSTVPGPADDQPSTCLTCCVFFSSPEPLSVRSTLLICDHLGNRFAVEVCASADRCLLTVWPHLARHRARQHIVFRTAGVPPADAHQSDSQVPVEAVLLQRCQSPSPASCITCSSSSSAPYGTPSRTSVSDEGPGSTSRGEQQQAEGVLLAAQRWFTLFGWPDGTHAVTIPHTLRRVASKIQMEGSGGRCYRVIQSKDSRSVLDMLHHLSSAQFPGVPLDQWLPADVGPRTNRLLAQHEAMLAFLSERGASLAHIRPEYLLDTHEYNHWCCLQDKESELDYSRVDYESLSKRSWLDVMLQIYKVLVLCRVTLDPEAKGQPEVMDPREVIGHPALMGSNVYSSWELHLLAWLNTHYQATRSSVWSAGELPAARWVVNFDLDLADGLVLAALLAAYCPPLASSHLQRMYTRSSSVEQTLHNNIIVVQALSTLCLNVDLQPTDLSDPNPVQMLLLCVHLYEHLPRLRPLSTVTFSGELHSPVTKQVRLNSPSSKPLHYECSLLGSDAHFFSLPGGSSAVTIPPRGSADVSVRFACCSMRPLEALLLLTSCSPIGPPAATLTFALQARVTRLKPTRRVRCVSPCYQLERIQVPVANPFTTDACFRVLLTELRAQAAENDANALRFFQQASVDAIVSPEEESDSESRGTEAGEFFSAVTSVCLRAGQTESLEVLFLPLSDGTKHCSLLLLCPQVGDMVYSVKAVAELPLACPLTATPTACLAPPLDTAEGGEPALGLRCAAGEACEVLLRVPWVNKAHEAALVLWARRRMGARERWRQQQLADAGSSVRTTTAAAALRVATKQGLEYSVEVSKPRHFRLPRTVTVPDRPALADEDADVLDPAAAAERECVSVPVSFRASEAGLYRCRVVLRSWLDTRVYVLEMLVTAQGGHAHLDFTVPAQQSVTQVIPLHNETRRAWRLRAVVSGPGFSGPELLHVPAESKASYPLTFRPAVQCVVTGKLSLVNDRDATEQHATVTLRGAGQRPLAAASVVLHCQARQVTHTEFRVPNRSRHTLSLQGECRSSRREKGRSQGTAMSPSLDP